MAPRLCGRITSLIGGYNRLATAELRRKMDIQVVNTGQPRKKEDRQGRRAFVCLPSRWWFHSWESQSRYWSIVEANWRIYPIDWFADSQRENSDVRDEKNNNKSMYKPASASRNMTNDLFWTFIPNATVHCWYRILPDSSQDDFDYHRQPSNRCDCHSRASDLFVLVWSWLELILHCTPLLAL